MQLACENVWNASLLTSVDVPTNAAMHEAYLFPPEPLQELVLGFDAAEMLRQVLAGTA